MSSTRPLDDGEEALVAMVLRAVDLRLQTLREQLVDLTNTVTRNHADLRAQILACRESMADDSQGAHHLPHAANTLTKRVDPTVLASIVLAPPVPETAVSAPAVSAPTLSPPTLSPPTSPVPEPIAPTPMASTVTFAPGVTVAAARATAPSDDDIDDFLAQLDVRLSALVDQAIGA